MPTSKPLLAVVGRPNVGKSTLFNRLIGDRQAITSDTPGTTRDRLYGDVHWSGRELTLVDTGGLADGDELQVGINTQVAEAISEADAIVFVVDVQAGVTPADHEIAEGLRRTAKPVVVVANKADNPTLAAASTDFWELGLTEPQPVAASHGRSTGDLLDVMLELFVDWQGVDETDTEQSPAVALVGRPNVGKSTLFNQLTATQSRITDAAPNTTRDLGISRIDTPAGPLRLIDTAGVQRRGKSGIGLAKYSLLRTLRGISQADVCCLLIDAIEGPTVQDAHITEYVQEAGKSLVIVVNKWDAVEKEGDIQETFFHSLQERLRFLPDPPVVFLSAKTGAKVDQLARAVYDVYELAGRRVETGELNRFVGEALVHLPAVKGRGVPKLYYITQVDTRPPTFTVFVNKERAWADQHRRYLVNLLREEYGLLGTPIRLQFRQKMPREVTA